ncbi:MAG: NAD(P)/FAD-dependent oxidoreductase [Phormidium tanganyikae FI6-MK23]|jgi:carotene isomerase|nr:NAD(P)/FAD-dependent oxidoreductase [Phormidium tanganyikae FI6-MK23]
MQNADVIVIGSGIGGLVTGALLARYGKSVIVCESHSIPGGAVHAFSRQGFHFDSGASFYCGLSDRHSVNPLRQVLDVLGESVEAVPYDPFGHYHFPDATLPVYGNLEKYRSAISQISPQGAIELVELEKRFLNLYDGLRGIPTLALRSDWKLAPILLSRYLPSLLKLLPHLGMIQGSVGNLMDQTVRDPWVRRLIDLECFLLSGLKAHGTIAPEVAFMFGERTRSVIDYPIGGSGAIVDALVRGLKKWGGTLKLGTHIEKILVESGKVRGIRSRNGEEISASIVISNASIWDTYSQLLEPSDLPSSYRQKSLKTPAINSFMHLHLGIRAEGLENLTGHHVVIQDDRDITVPGNTCMISIPTVWDKNLAPSGYHVVHAYTLEPFEGWTRDSEYESKKLARSQSLFRAVERIIPALRNRIVLELIGTPLTHARYLRRYQGTYGAGIPAGQGLFPNCHTPIANLYRVGDSTMPGIGVPAVAASGILCANTIVDPAQTLELVDLL